ncbi:MAG: PilZ domain-containing protein [Alphaproteobacteria bacterium]|nr:PilZ domain-containing protein [Alphaproteobacteria bacterium]
MRKPIMTIAPSRPAMAPQVKPETDRRRYQRVNIRLLGRFSMPNRLEYPCQTLNMSPGGIAINAPVRPEVGHKLILQLDMLGQVQGQVVRHMDMGFALELEQLFLNPEKLADQLTWLANRSPQSDQDARRHIRIEPRHRHVKIETAGLPPFAGILLNISRSGACLETDRKLSIGTDVKIGRLAAHVVREVAIGFAVAFDEIIPAHEFSSDIKL